MRSTLTILAAGMSLAAVAMPAMAQDVSGKPDNLKIGGDRVSIGVGLSSTPNYIGAKHSILTPTAAIQGQISGINFNTSGTAIGVDVIAGSGKPGWKLELGPLLALRLDRNGRIGDKAVKALGQRKIALELGGSIGVQRMGVITSDYDTLTFSLSYQHDVTHAHRSYVISPEIDYDTPLSDHMFVSFSASADYIGGGFGRYYYDVDSAGSAASGLPIYTGADKAGWKDWNLNMMVVHSLTGTLTHGLGLFATGGYQHILGAYRRSPIVDQVGSPNQWSGAIGLEYSF